MRTIDDVLNDGVSTLNLATDDKNMKHLLHIVIKDAVNSVNHATLLQANLLIPNDTLDYMYNYIWGENENTNI